MTNFDGISNSIFLMPLKSIKFYNSATPTDEHTFTLFYPEQESSWKATKVEVPHSEGGTKVLGWNLDFTLYIPHNDFSLNNSNKPQKFVDYFRAKSKNIKSTSDDNHYHVMIYLGDSANSTGSLDLFLCNYNGRLSISYEMEQVEFRPRMILYINYFQKTLDSIFTG
jgi:hypothetical protein